MSQSTDVDDFWHTPSPSIPNALPFPIIFNLLFRGRNKVFDRNTRGLTLWDRWRILKEAMKIGIFTIL